MFIAVILVRTNCGRGGGVTVYQPDSEDLQDELSFSSVFNILDVCLSLAALLLYDLPASSNAFVVEEQ